MKKIIVTFAFILTIALGTSVFAAGTDVPDCAKMDKGKCVSMCAKEMNRGVSEWATSTDCPMTTGCHEKSKRASETIDALLLYLLMYNATCQYTY